MCFAVGLVGDLSRLHLCTSRPRLALAALPASLQAGTGSGEVANKMVRRRFQTSLPQAVHMLKSRYPPVAVPGRQHRKCVFICLARPRAYHAIPTRSDLLSLFQACLEVLSLTTSAQDRSREGHPFLTGRKMWHAELKKCLRLWACHR